MKAEPRDSGRRIQDASNGKKKAARLAAFFHGVEN